MIIMLFSDVDIYNKQIISISISTDPECIEHDGSEDGGVAEHAVQHAEHQAEGVEASLSVGEGNSPELHDRVPEPEKVPQF